MNTSLCQVMALLMQQRRLLSRATAIQMMRCFDSQRSHLARPLVTFPSQPRCHFSTLQAHKPKPTPAILSVQPPNPNWRESTSLIITARDAQPSSQYDYSILLVKRSGGSTFFPSAMVFPGGRVELPDFDTKWYSLYERLGIDRSQLDQSISDHITGPRLPIVRDPITAREFTTSGAPILNSDIALRIAAIRETFEEAGILLLTTPDQRNQPCTAVTLSGPELAEWQLRVRTDASAFIELCESRQMVPDLWSLYEWTDWLTPLNAHNKRYDTIFYLCCLGKRPEVRVDNAEVTKPIWSTPLAALSEHRQGEAFMAPPQVYEMSRMLHFGALDELHDFAQKRQTLGLERWMPVMQTVTDGTLFLLPGDERYPDQPEMIESQPLECLDTTIAEQETVQRQNLSVFIGEHCQSVCTIEPPCGHKQPIRFDGTLDIATN